MRQAHNPTKPAPQPQESAAKTHPLHPQALVLRLQGAVALLKRLHCRTQRLIGRRAKVQRSAIPQPQLRPAEQAVPGGEGTSSVHARWC